jgi:hypothetical protein
MYISAFNGSADKLQISNGICHSTEIVLDKGSTEMICIVNDSWGGSMCSKRHVFHPANPSKRTIESAVGGKGMLKSRFFTSRWEATGRTMLNETPVTTSEMRRVRIRREIFRGFGILGDEHIMIAAERRANPRIVQPRA